MIQIVAELGLNHRGNFYLAADMVRTAALTGCTGVKLQTYRWQDFVTLDHPMRETFEECEIWQYLGRLVDVAHEVGLEIGTTPTSLEGVQEAVDAGCDFLKNGSDFLLRTDLIQAMLDTGLPTWVSTGMATPEEIQQVPEGAKLMVCTSLYPCPPEHANLNRLWRIHGSGRWAGYSDHTEGIEAAVIAAFVGAELIEKHFSLSKTAHGPDHAFSADPAEMAALVKAVRKAELMRGSSDIPVEAELVNRDRWRVKEGALRTG